MKETTTPMDTSPDPISPNAFLIRPKKGATKALKAVNADLKRAGCHWHMKGAWSCPIGMQDMVETMLAHRQISVEIVLHKDDYFDKSRRGQEAENVWMQIDIKERQHHAEDRALITERAVLEKEIETRGLSPDDAKIQSLLKELDRRGAAQKELQDEIDQLRNGAKLLEEKTESMLPFHILGHNTKREILLWKEGRLIALPAARLNKDELRLYIGSESEWFQSEDLVKTLKEAIIDAAHKKGFIDDVSPLRSGLWRVNDKWLIISGKKAGFIEEGRFSYLKAPLFEGKLVETEGAAWLAWEVFEMSIGNRALLKESFDLLHSKIKQWNWVVPSMAAFVTAFVMLSIAQQAMKWRPWIYVTGAASTGKTTFWENILQHIYGGLVERLDKSTAHATAQTIGNSGRIPVFDEFEKHKHIPEILELAKLFNKGGQKTSGTGSDKAHRFDLHHMPWFGSIYLPKKFMQDAAQESRLVKFELNKIPQGAPAVDKFDDDGQVISAKITAAVITMWEVLEEKAQKINADRHRLLQEHPGIKIRTVENFMYASALLEIVAPEGLEESFPMWAATQTEDDGDKLLDTILASLIFVDGDKRSVREMLQTGQHEEQLERHGVKIVVHKAKRYLALRCENITRHLLKDTEYASLDIKGPLARTDGAIGSVQVKITGTNQRCILIPMEKVESE